MELHAYELDVSSRYTEIKSRAFGASFFESARVLGVLRRAAVEPEVGFRVCQGQSITSHHCPLRPAQMLYRFLRHGLYLGFNCI